MDFRFTEQEERFRQEVRDFIERELPPALRHESHSAAYSIEHLQEEKEFRRKATSAQSAKRGCCRRART